MQEFETWFSQLRFDFLWEIILTAGSCILCITFHELCHGWVAYLLGDPTAKNAGRLTLNPLKHLDVAGLLMLILVKFGWAKPVPVNMNYFKRPKTDMALTALAGPLGNVFLSAICVLFISICTFYMVYFDQNWLFYLQQFLSYTAILSIGLAVFNLFPIPPLDGSKVLLAILPERIYCKWMCYERYGMIALIIILFSGILDKPLFFLRDSLLQLLTLTCSWPFYVLRVIYF